MSESREFYIQDDGIRIHMKLDIPGEDRAEGGTDDRSGCAEDGKQGAAGSIGKLPLMILIHGFTGNMEETHILGVQRAANEAGCAVLRAEMYGHGLSGGKFEDHTLFKWIGNAIKVIDYARTLDFVSDMYLCGHSQGGLLTILVGAMERDRLRALLELSPASMIPEIARQGELLGVPFDPDNIPPYLDAGKSLIIRENYIRVAQMIDVDSAVSRYTGPVLIVHGTADQSVPFHYSRELAEKYADARLVAIEGDSHCYDYHLDQVEEAVRSFLLETAFGSGLRQKQSGDTEESTLLF